LFNNYENNHTFKILLKVYYMQLPRGLDGILRKIEDNVKDNFEKIKGKIREFPKYLDERLEEIGNTISTKFKEYTPIIVGAAISASPLYAKAPILTGLHIKNLYKGTGGKVLGYGLIGVGVAAAIGLGIMFGLNAIHSLPSNHVEYLGSPNGYEAFVPNGQTIPYHGHTDPTGTLVLPDGKTIGPAVWDGQYANTIIQNHDQIVQLNNQFVGQTDPVNNQPYVPLQDFYVIKGQVPIEQVTINGQTYYVIQANSINPANIAGFYTYQGWIDKFIVAMNTQGTYAARIPGNSPVFQWTNTTGTVAYQTMLYGQYGPFPGGAVLVQSNGTIIPYGVDTNIPAGTYLSNFYAPQQVYNSSS